MQTLDLEPFARHMCGRKIVEERQIPYYLKWVRHFLTAELPPMATSTPDRVQAFSDLVARNPNVLDWQHRQALRAVELYLKVFLARTNPAAAPSSGSTEARPGDVEHTLEEMRGLIRLETGNWKLET